MPLVTILARKMRMKIFEVDQALEMLRVAPVTILAREMRLKFFEVDQRLEMLRVALVTIFISGKVYHPEPPHAQSLFLFPLVFGINLILAREMRLKFF